MGLFTDIVLASSNAGKIREFSAFFKPYNVRIIPQNELGIKSTEEPYSTFIENSLAKARHAAKLSGKPALADDSGICATALKDAPGIYSARYSGDNATDAENNAKLTQALKNESNRQVWYACSLVLVRHEKDPSPIIATGTWEGEWIDEARGENGFGYDPQFYLPEYKLTAAEISPSLKNRISHRGKALLELMQKIDDLYLRAGMNIPEKPFYMEL